MKPSKLDPILELLDTIPEPATRNDFVRGLDLCTRITVTICKTAIDRSLQFRLKYVPEKGASLLQ